MPRRTCTRCSTLFWEWTDSKLCITTNFMEQRFSALFTSASNELYPEPHESSFITITESLLLLPLCYCYYYYCCSSPLVIAVIVLVLGRNADNRECNMAGTFRKHGRFLYLRTASYIWLPREVRFWISISVIRNHSLLSFTKIKTGQLF